MKIVIVGSGNVAVHLAKTLYDHHHQILQVWSKQYENALQLAKIVGAEAISDFKQINRSADLCLIAVKDDAILSIAEQITDFRGIVAHTAGSVSLNIFEGKLANYGVFYPLQTFSKDKHIDFATIPLCLEANSDKSLNLLKVLAGELSQTVVEIDSEKRKILHLSAVFACNFVNHMYALADDILKANGLDFKLIVPLIEETALKVKDRSPVSVQTGPAVRHDKKTMEAHEQLLVSHPHLLEIYKIVSNSIKKTDS